MEKNRKYSQEESTLLQEISQTYRYPDGSLNGIAVFISALALVLLLILGHFTIKGIQNIKNMGTVSASEMSLEEIEKYFNDYISNNGSLTEQQKKALNQFISQYLDELSLQESVEKNEEAFNNIEKTINSYISSNEENLALMQELIKNEITRLENQSAADNSDIAKQIAELKELNSKLKQLGKDNYCELERIINNNAIKSSDEMLKLYQQLLDTVAASDATNASEQEKLLQQIEALESNTESYKDSNNDRVTAIENNAEAYKNSNDQRIKDIENNTAAYIDSNDKRIKALEDKSRATDAPTTSSSSDAAEFDFGYKNGSYGYWINGTLHMF